MTRDDQKKAAAEAALKYVVAGTIIGVGTGSTANYFIDALARMTDPVAGAVASSDATAARLKDHSIPVVELNDVDRLPLYVDGADEANGKRQLVKGGGGALTREKIVAAASDNFICIIDAGKRVDVLGAFPLPVEVVPTAARLVSRRLHEMGGEPLERENFTTDNGNPIIDVSGLEIDDPEALESRINQLAGVVTCGLFALRPADLLLIGTETGVEEVA